MRLTRIGYVISAWASPLYEIIGIDANPGKECFFAGLL
jgi:hypothetical protein